MDVPVLEILGVSKSFHRRGGATHTAVRDVSLTVNKGETLALVGESGSGKSTLAKIALGLLPPDAGMVRLLGQPIYHISNAELRRIRIAMQPVFQDSSMAFNPRRTVRQLLAQTLQQQDIRHDADQRIITLLEKVRLDSGADFLSRFPHELSGGQRQRLAIARAIAMDPAVIVADEPLSGADVSIRGHILNLLLDLRRERDIALLFITHDIEIARAFAHRVAVMYRGDIVEQGETAKVIDTPAHPYTQRLVHAAHGLAGVGAAKGSTDARPQACKSVPSQHALIEE
jgi:ABC-type glutathione transport system ATPase component